MHEFSVAQSILNIVTKYAEKEGAERITKVGIKIGGFSCIEPSSLTFCFDIIKKDTPVCNAVLDIERESIKGFCGDCGKGFEVEGFVMECPFCKGKGFKVSGDDDMKVVYMEVE